MKEIPSYYPPEKLSILSTVSSFRDGVLIGKVMVGVGGRPKKLKHRKKEINISCNEERGEMRRGIHCQKIFAHKKWHKQIVVQSENTPSAIPHYFLMVHPLTAETSNPLSRTAYVQSVTKTMKSFFPAAKQHSNKHPKL